MKRYYCAKCGLRLEVVQKANPREGTVMNLVIPHECEVMKVEEGPFRGTKEIIKKAPDLITVDDMEGEQAGERSFSNLDEDVQPKEVSTKEAFKVLDKETEKKLDKKIDKLFDEFPFVKKLDKDTAEHETVTQESGDKRDRKHLREELVTSSAPLNVLDMAARSNVKPAHDLEESEK